MRSDVSAAAPRASLEAVESMRQYFKACVRVASSAQLFASTCDAAPLRFGSFEQGELWDELTAALAVLEEFDSDESAPRSGAS